MIRVLFHNHPGRISRPAARSWWQARAQDHDVMMAAEASHLLTRRVGLKGAVIDYLPGWDAFAPIHTSNLAATPILWRTSKLAMVEAMPRRHYKSTHVGSWGAGPAWMKDGWTNAAKLVERNGAGQAWGLAVGHWVPSVQQSRENVERQGQEALASWELRRKLHRIETEGAAGLLDDMTALWGCPALVCGDTNAVPTWGGLEALRDVADAIYPGPTHGQRAIDGFWLHEGARAAVRITDARVIPGPLADDHDAVSLTLHPR